MPNPIYILAVIFLVALFLLNKTKYGRGLYAIGGNAETARLAGVSVKSYTVLSYIFGAVLFSIAGMILAGRLGMGTATVGDGLRRMPLLRLLWAARRLRAVWAA